MIFKNKCMDVEGIFAVDKPLGITSQRAVQIVKYWARRKTGNKKIKVGHAGTLDPLASGVLVIAIGRSYTKKLDYVVKSEKEYVAEVMLGETSETDDAEGEKQIVNKKIKANHTSIEKVVQKFIGDIKQTPSIYSAVKIDGQEAYKRARRGEEVQMKERIVSIKDIKIIEYKYPIIKLRVVCGKGTYIRSLARDIGNELNTGAYLSGLQRTRVGDFVLKNSKELNKFSLKIAVHAAELDNERIDGTRVYISEVLKSFGKLTTEDHFFLYHQKEFNKLLAPPNKDNFHVKKIAHVPFWTQTRFAWNVFSEKIDVLWMPVHNVPLFHRKDMKIITTIHDLAFKVFPETFPQDDVRKLNSLTNHAVKRADHIIAVSKATKRDLLRFYPHLSVEKITVVPHGITIRDWQKEFKGNIVQKVLENYNVKNSKYIIHVGAIQPRKNIKILIDAFVDIKKERPDLKLMLVGGNGWLWEDIHAYARNSEYAQDIIFTGNITFVEVQILLQHARVFVFPSQYEGFGIAGLEACAARVPVVAARNSSIPEVLGDAPLYFDTMDSNDCARQIEKVFGNEKLQQDMIQKGLKRAQKFTWDKCGKKTLQILRK